jgi:Kinesin-associated protein (KAP).
VLYTLFLFQEFVGDIAKAVIDCPNEDFVVECVGVLGNMTLPDLDFCQLMQRFNLIPWVQNILVPGKSVYSVPGMMTVAKLKLTQYLTLSLHAHHI